MPQAGIKLFFYHSQLDWHHPDYFPRGNTGGDYTGRPESGDFNKYLDYMMPQRSRMLITTLWETLRAFGLMAYVGPRRTPDWRLEKNVQAYSSDLKQPHWLEANHSQKRRTNGKIFQMLKKSCRHNSNTGILYMNR
jgi:alpha-L-fucosidase